MELEHSFTVPVPPEQAWAVLLDVEQVAPCMPGATIDSVDGDVITGKIKVKVGPVALTYSGKAQFTEKDEQNHAVVLEASGKETRGSGTASATVHASLQGEGEQTRVAVHTALTVTGRPAQFGRGVIAEVGGRIIDKFATNLATQLASGGTPATSGAAASTGAASTGGSAAAQGSAAGAPAVAAAAPPVEAAGGGSELGERPADPAQAPIEELNLPVRSFNSLRREGVHTVGGLTARTERSLLAIEGLGPQSVKEIRNRLASWGLALADDSAGPAGPATSGPAGPASTDYPGTDTVGSVNGSLPPRAVRPPDEDALDLLSVAGLPILKRALPALGAAVAVLLLFGLLRRRRRKAGS